MTAKNLQTPVLKPTFHQFNNFETFMEDIYEKKLHLQTGIVIIEPPKEWKPMKCDMPNNNNDYLQTTISAVHQIKQQHQFIEGAYQTFSVEIAENITISQYQSRAKAKHNDKKM